MNEEQYKKKIGGKVRYLRKSKKWTYKDLSKKTGLSIPFLSDVEKGRSAPSIYSVHLICNALGVNVGDILD